ncbi:MAG: hypothetical protein PWQ41_998 [Bacillota bacterium]|jgi:hypothetical protein|nr:hypothetical protein [Bacillota bacterium]MDK2855080.1 hypothetical protein [Bacillota bacterium]MDK2925224.1 hypothetical protein [Bacillota bacterium]
MPVMTILRLLVHILFLAFFYRFLYSIVKAIERDLGAAGRRQRNVGSRYPGLREGE